MDQKTRTIIDNAASIVNKIKINEEKVGVEGLMTRYRSGYLRLLERGKKAVNDLVRVYLTEALYNMPQKDGIVENYLSTLPFLMDDCWKAVHDSYDIYEATVVALPYWFELKHSVFDPFWLSHIYQEDGYYKCSLPEMEGLVFIPEYGGYWGYTSGEPCLVKAAMPPATKELCDKEFAVYIERLKSLGNLTC